VDQALAANQSLKVAAARLDQAHAQLSIARADLFPTVALGAAATRAKTSANRPLSSYTIANQSTVQNDFKIGPQVGYEVDLFGRVRREVEGARASAEQAEADYENARLILLATLASDYFSLREVDAEIEVVRHSLELQRDALSFVQSRHELGFATGLDLAQQQSLLDSSATQLELLGVQRAQLEHAIATLVGRPRRSSNWHPRRSRHRCRRCGGAAGGSVAAAARCRLGGTRHGGGQCPDRGREGGVLPQYSIAAGHRCARYRLGGQCACQPLRSASRLWSVGLSASETLFDAGRTRAKCGCACRLFGGGCRLSPNGF